MRTFKAYNYISFSTFNIIVFLNRCIFLYCIFVLKHIDIHKKKQKPLSIYNVYTNQSSIFMRDSMIDVYCSKLLAKNPPNYFMAINALKIYKKKKTVCFMMLLSKRPFSVINGL